MAAKKKKDRKPKPEDTGTGMLRRAADAAANRAKRNCVESGGKFNAATGQCDFGFQRVDK